MNELSTTIGISTAIPLPIRLAAARARRRRGAMSPAALGRSTFARSMTAIGSAAHPDAFPALLHQVLRYAGYRRAVGEDARVGVEPDVDGVVLDRGHDRVLQGGRVVGRVKRDGQRVVERRGDRGRRGRRLAVPV